MVIPTHSSPHIYKYNAFDLNISSELELPEFRPSIVSRDDDIFIRFGKINIPIVEPPADEYRSVQKVDDGVFIYWRDIGSVLIRDGSEIFIDPLPDSSMRLVRLLIMGVALGVLMHQRSVYTLHGSAVSIDGMAITFIGWKGMGKSTTAAYLNEHGHPLVSDDVVAIEFQENGDLPIVNPAYPQLKLWPEAAEASLGEKAHRLETLHPDSVRLAHLVDQRFRRDPLPLACIYVLDYLPEGHNETIVEQIEPREAIIELIRHSYALRFLGEHGTNGVHLSQCTRLIREVPIRRLRRVPSLELLPDVARCIEEDQIDSVVRLKS